MCRCQLSRHHRGWGLSVTCLVLQAAHAMVRCLAGSLAMVTCKEPLRSALAQHLRQLLQVGAPGYGVGVPKTLSQAVSLKQAPAGRLHEGLALSRSHECRHDCGCLSCAQRARMFAFSTSMMAVQPAGMLRWATHLCIEAATSSAAATASHAPPQLILDAACRPQVPGLEPTALDNAVNTVTADNLDLGCRMIEKAAHDKAVTDIDARLAAGYAVRL